MKTKLTLGDIKLYALLLIICLLMGMGITMCKAAEINQETIAYWKYRLTHERQHESALPVVYTVARMELKGE